MGTGGGLPKSALQAVMGHSTKCQRYFRGILDRIYEISPFLKRISESKRFHPDAKERFEFV